MGEYDPSLHKRCNTCGRQYDADSWRELRNPKIWKWPEGDTQEIRQCPCGSTLAVVLETGDTL